MAPLAAVTRNASEGWPRSSPLAWAALSFGFAVAPPVGLELPPPAGGVQLATVNAGWGWPSYRRSGR